MILDPKTFRKSINSTTERFNTGTFLTKAKSYERLKPSQDSRPGAANSPVGTIPYFYPSEKEATSKY